MRAWTSSQVSRLLVAAAIALISVSGPGATAAAGADDAATDDTAERPESVELYAYNLQHRDAPSALAIVLPLLSSRGTVEVQPGGNAIVVRDTPTALGKIRPKLRDFDLPTGLLNLRVQIVRAEKSETNAGAAPELSPEILSRLRELLRYQTYSLVASAEFHIGEGMKATQDVGSKYRVDFRLKRILADGRASLESFRLSRSTGEGFEPLIHTNLNLDLETPMVLGLAPTESSDRAIMIVIDSSPELEPRAAKKQ